MKKNKIFIALYLFFLLFTPIVSILLPDLSPLLVPHFYFMILWGIPILIIFNLKNIFNVLVALFWIAWFLIGSINTIASYFVYGDLYLFDVEYPNWIYYIFTLVFVFSLYFSENFNKKPLNPIWQKKLKRNFLSHEINPVVGYFLILFPFLWFGSIFKTIGYIPILSGSNVEENMYSDYFGPLYGYAAINILSMLFVFDKFLNSQLINKKIFYAILLIAFMFISVMTGKRMSLIIFFTAAFCYFLKNNGLKAFNLSFIIVSCLIVIVFYSGILFLRQGNEKNNNGSRAKELAIVGVEYRDFAWAINNIDPKNLTSHQWATSTFAAGMNSKVLSLFGIEKAKLTQKGLGFVSKPYFMGGFFGVRTGIISELYFAYSFFGVIVIFFFGLFTAYVTRLLQNSDSKFSSIFHSTIFSLLQLAILEQSIDIVGTLPVLFYFWILSVAILIPLYGKIKS